MAMASPDHRLLGEHEVAVVIAMPVMLMVQVAIDQIVDVIAMRHRGVSAAWAMHVRLVVTLAGMAAGAPDGVLLRHREDVVFDAVSLDMPKVSVLEVVEVTIVPHALVAAI